MDQAGRALLGEHDFLSYCRPRAGATTIRTLQTLRWERPGPGMADEGLVVATVEADAFCHHMVRSLVGADRKSTRLNSSHVAISYAVLCSKNIDSSPR